MAEKGSSKNILPSGKENVRPSTSGVKKKQVSFSHREDFRRRLCLCSNDDKKKENGGKKTRHPVFELLPAKKTPFHVHYDESNVEEDREDREPVKRSKIVSSGSGAKRREECAAGSAQTNLDDATKDKKLLPSKIPLRFRSSSACAPNTKPQEQIRRSASVEIRTIRPEERCCKAADLKFGWCGGRVVVEQSKLKSFANETRVLIKKPVGDTKSSRHLVLSHNKLESIRVPSTRNPVEIKKPKVINKCAVKPIDRSSKSTVETARISRKETTNNIFRPNRNPSTSNIDRIGPRAIDRIKANLLRQESRSGASNITLRPESNTETPVDGSIPPTLALQGAILKKTNAQRTESQGTQEKDSCQAYDNFPTELLYNTEYLDEIPMTEYKREKQAPKLSNDFLEKHLNAEQRRLVVIFMLRLGTHCRYPSFIVFQAVKLFDVVMDRINVEIPYIQLVALTSLWIALKRHHYYYRIPNATKIVGLAGDLYTDRQDLLITYERKILSTMNFNITFADPFSLFTHYLVSCEGCITLSDDAAAFIYYIGGYLIDITLLDESLCRMSTCLIALSAMELALGLTIDFAVASARPRWLFWRGILFTVSPSVTARFADKDIDQVRTTILNRVLSSAGEHSGFSVVYKKYNRSRYGRISTALLERVCKISSSEMFVP